MLRGGLNCFASAAATELVASETRIQLFPMGRHIGRDGRGPYILKDKAHAERVIAATRQSLRSSAFMIDYDHQVAAAPDAGSKAPAAGWIDPGTLTADENGIWGIVEWTRAGQEAVAQREYRYISPFFAHTKEGEVLALWNAALVNIPNLELQAVASRSFGESETMKSVAKALGLAEDSTEEQVLGAVTILQSGVSSIATALGLAAAAPAAEIATAAAAAKAGGEVDKTKFVPISDLAAANARIDALEGVEAAKAVDAAIAAGKITPANRDYYVAQCKTDPAAFATAMGNAPAVLKPGESDARGKVAIEALTPEQKALCSSMGWDQAEYLKQLQADALEETH